MRYRVALTDPRQHPPDPALLDLLHRCDAFLDARDCPRREDVITLCAGADAIVVAGTPLDGYAISSLQNCRAIVRTGTGYDNIDVEAAARARIPVSNVPELCTDDVADHTLAMLLACARRLFEGDRGIRASVWNPLYLMPVGRLGGQVLGLVGFGKIGQAVARRAIAFGLSLIYYDPFRQEAPRGLQAAACESVDQLLFQADYVSVHVPLTKQTRGMLAMPQFQRMKRTSILINCARVKLLMSLT